MSPELLVPVVPTVKPRQIELKQFIKRRRDGKNQRVGVMYAQVLPRIAKDASTGEFLTLPGSEVTIGFSLCSKNDEFCPYTAEEIAFNRSLAYIDRAPFVVVSGAITKNIIPDSIKTDFAVFIGRAERFFQEYTLPEWAAQYYTIHHELVEKFFVKLAEEKTVKAALLAITSSTNIPEV